MSRAAVAVGVAGPATDAVPVKIRDHAGEANELILQALGIVRLAELASEATDDDFEERVRYAMRAAGGLLSAASKIALAIETDHYEMRS